jgi:D-psicose/D-tagatose/L-ribulose 3-epimerase
MPPQKFSICNETFAPLGSSEPWSFTQTCEFVKSVGYDGIELAPFTFAEDIRTVSSARRMEIQRIATDNGLEICGLHWLLISPPGLHLHTTDSGLRSKTRDYLLALIEFASDVGAPTLVLGSPKARTLENNDFAGAWSRTKEALGSLADALESAGVTLCPEALPAPECDFLRTQAEIARLCNEIGHPNVQMMLDVKSMCSEPDGPATLIRRYGHLARHLHANDANRRGPGAGETDFFAIAEAARASGFTGWVSVEVFDYSQGAEAIARASLAHLQAAWDVSSSFATVSPPGPMSQRQNVPGCPTRR